MFYNVILFYTSKTSIDRKTNKLKKLSVKNPNT